MALKKVLKILAVISLSLLCLLLLLINMRLLTAPDLKNRTKICGQVILQLHFLEDQMKHDDLANKMQQLYPEGFVFAQVLYGLSWCEAGRVLREQSDIYRKALSEATGALHAIESERGRNNFDARLQPQYGIFYRGWHNYLWGKILALQSVADTAEQKRYQINCQQIAQVFATGNAIYPESYSKTSWPADAFVAVASLKLHDQLNSPQYESLISNWLSKVKEHLDPVTGLVPHQADYVTGDFVQGSRGSSISLILIFLADIDRHFAARQMELFKQHFLMNQLGLHAIREYPKGEHGKGDIDSGPVIMGMSLAGSIVSVGSLLKQGEVKLAGSISSAIECFGLANTTSTEKKYLLGAYPMADLFIAWTQLQQPSATFAYQMRKNGGDSNVYFYLFSLAVWIVSVYLIKRLLPFNVSYMDEKSGVN
jgi:hypothetical protein